MSNKKQVSLYEHATSGKRILDWQLPSGKTLGQSTRKEVREHLEKCEHEVRFLEALLRELEAGGS